MPIVMRDNKIIKNANEVKIDNNINVILYKGEIEAKVKRSNAESNCCSAKRDHRLIAN